MASGVTAGAQVASTALDFIRGQQELAMKGRAISDAEQNARVQGELTSEQLADQRTALLRQWQLATAGQEDVYGNRVIFDPTSNTWVTATSPQGQALINRSDAIQRANDVRALTQGQTEQDIGYQRRLDQGAAASPLLTQFARGYGAPTREGVVGRQAVAAATGSGEAADLARSGITAAALRSNGAIPNLQYSLSGLDRGAATGLRSALAQDYSPVYEEMKANYNSNRLNPYGTLASSASNASNIPFAPSSLPGTLNSDVANRAANAKISVPPAYAPGYGINSASGQLINALGNYKMPNYGGMGSTLGTSLGDLYKSIWPGSGGAPSVGTGTGTTY
jgi:hypothetical protein